VTKINQQSEKTNPTEAVNAAIRSGQFKLKTEMSDPERMACALDWGARLYPYGSFHYNILLMAIRGYSKVPSINSKDVDLLRGKMARVRQILMRDYKRTTCTLIGVGIRATVDVTDLGDNAVPKAKERKKQANNGLIAIEGIADLSTLPAGPEGDRVRAIFSSVRELNRFARQEAPLLAKPIPGAPKGSKKVPPR
jgi:hypothetical protein